MSLQFINSLAVSRGSITTLPGLNMVNFDQTGVDQI
jgi:hypothetical protein